MLAYWVAFLSTFILAVFARNRPQPSNFNYPNNITPLWSLLWVLLTLYVGGRYLVGGDFAQYKWLYFRFMDWDLRSIIFFGAVDPGFGLLYWVCNQLNIGFIGANFVGASIFTFCLVKYCRSLPRPFLALLVAMPYMVNIVGMGYIRQSIALGLAMMAILELRDGKNFKFFMIIALAATFHKSVIIFFPLAIFVSTKNKLFLLAASILLVFVGYIAFIEAEIERVLIYYIGRGYSSGGALIRVGMVLLPAILFLLYKNKFKISEREKKLWTIFAIAAFPAFLILIFGSISTTVDRFALYALPLQLFLFSYLPDVFSKKSNQVVVLAICFYYAVVLFVWLNFANNASSWVPYDNVLRALYDDTGYFKNITWGIR
jgi:hypothetical protein